MWPYLILGNTSLEPVSVMLYQMSRAASAQLQDNQIMLLMMLSVVPPLTVYALFSKHIMGGFNMSGIKG
jgi:ABC-type glycerol-3-phosphate transport system permease component